jgi:hypothetical protein
MITKITRLPVLALDFNPITAYQVILVLVGKIGMFFLVPIDSVEIITSEVLRSPP